MTIPNFYTFLMLVMVFCIKVHPHSTSKAYNGEYKNYMYETIHLLNFPP